MTLSDRLHVPCHRFSFPFHSLLPLSRSHDLHVANPKRIIDQLNSCCQDSHPSDASAGNMGVEQATRSSGKRAMMKQINTLEPSDPASSPHWPLPALPLENGSQQKSTPRSKHWSRRVSSFLPDKRFSKDTRTLPLTPVPARRTPGYIPEEMAACRMPNYIYDETQETNEEEMKALQDLTSVNRQAAVRIANLKAQLTDITLRIRDVKTKKSTISPAHNASNLSLPIVEEEVRDTTMRDELEGSIHRLLKTQPSSRSIKDTRQQDLSSLFEQVDREFDATFKPYEGSFEGEAREPAPLSEGWTWPDSDTDLSLTLDTSFTGTHRTSNSGSSAAYTQVFSNASSATMSTTNTFGGDLYDTLDAFPNPPSFESKREYHCRNDSEKSNITVASVASVESEIPVVLMAKHGYSKPKSFAKVEPVNITRTNTICSKRMPSPMPPWQSPAFPPPPVPTDIPAHPISPAQECHAITSDRPITIFSTPRTGFETTIPPRNVAKDSVISETAIRPPYYRPDPVRSHPPIRPEYERSGRSDVSVDCNARFRSTYRVPELRPLPEKDAERRLQCSPAEARRHVEGVSSATKLARYYSSQDAIATYTAPGARSNRSSVEKASKAWSLSRLVKARKQEAANAAAAAARTSSGNASTRSKSVWKWPFRPKTMAVFRRTKSPAPAAKDAAGAAAAVSRPRPRPRTQTREAREAAQSGMLARGSFGFHFQQILMSELADATQPRPDTTGRTSSHRATQAPSTTQRAACRLSTVGSKILSSNGSCSSIFTAMLEPGASDAGRTTKSFYSDYPGSQYIRRPSNSTGRSAYPGQDSASFTASSSGSSYRRQRPTIVEVQE
ncbi:hypothetical protein BDY17DRAFT_177597 [Neohortaea acidophila]|uniref:Uncharacterized protein n=1 Tax=Neohortaea acidophila TaxID=245834 RepID=A0A6A6PPT4_9PEZI|nr:uncharacterized protein BDY17DRAFT_177597 [Neohortaea acidophila]KAF2482120.1 hypothetical protein BDY17DRAFT_177597 [Neohortaea acidophila]